MITGIFSPVTLRQILLLSFHVYPHKTLTPRQKYFFKYGSFLFLCCIRLNYDILLTVVPIRPVSFSEKKDCSERRHNAPFPVLELSVLSKLHAALCFSRLICRYYCLRFFVILMDDFIRYYFTEKLGYHCQTYLNSERKN